MVCNDVTIAAIALYIDVQHTNSPVVSHSLSRPIVSLQAMMNKLSKHNTLVFGVLATIQYSNFTTIFRPEPTVCAQYYGNGRRIVPWKTDSVRAAVVFPLKVCVCVCVRVVEYITLLL